MPKGPGNGWLTGGRSGKRAAGGPQVGHGSYDVLEIFGMSQRLYGVNGSAATALVGAYGLSLGLVSAAAIGAIKRSATVSNSKKFLGI